MDSGIDGGNTAWVLISTALVMFMTPGLAFFYGGMVRAKNVLAMLMQNFFSLGLVSTIWAIIGFSLAFGSDIGGMLGGLDFLGMKGLLTTKALPGYSGDFALSIPAPAFFAYQMMFAVITPALISGAIADRMKFSAYALFIGLWSIICYSPVAHWVFSPNGWLFQRGALDFAGGTVVHINAGIAAFVLALFIGKRRNWPREAMPPHSLPLTLLGTGILWLGWIGFNAGSALSAGTLASQALINTHLAAATAMLGWLLAERIRKGHATTLGGASGAIAGLVAITPCAGFVGGCEAMIVGAVAGIVCAIAVDLKFRWGYDDSLDVVGVHLVGGLTGSILLGLFASKEINPGAVDGLFHGGGWTLLINQLVASVAVLAFTGLLTLAIAWIVNSLVGLRVDEESESLGLDTTQHAESAYLLVETGLGSRGTATKDVRPATSSAPQAS